MGVARRTSRTGSWSGAGTQKQDGAWDVSLSIAPHDELNTSRGTGSNDAWDNMAPLWTWASTGTAEPPTG